MIPTAYNPALQSFRANPGEWNLVATGVGWATEEWELQKVGFSGSDARLARLLSGIKLGDRTYAGRGRLSQPP